MNNKPEIDAETVQFICRKYRVLFRVLDVFFGIIEFIPKIPFFLWYLLTLAYIYTIYRAIVYVQIQWNLHQIKKSM